MTVSWWQRLSIRRHNKSPYRARPIVPGTVSAPGDGAIAIGGSAETVVGGHGNTVVVLHAGTGERVVGAASLDDLDASCRIRMVERWHAAGVSAVVAAELADTPQVGALPDAVTALPEHGVVVLEGVFGAGKSLAAERQHQRDIAAARANAQAPIPVRLAAQDVQGSLIDTATRAAAVLGDPAVRGVRLIVDGLEEPGPIRGKELLDQACSWTLSPAGARWRILATARPGLEVDEKLRRPMPALSADEAAALMDRLGGNGIAVHSQSGMVRSVLRQPLFAIIAAQIQRDHERLPNSPVAFLDALVTRALRDVESVKEERAERLLRRLAAVCVSAGGVAAAADVGSPGEVQVLLETRLVVRRGDRRLAFALPVLEQYFAGQALLANGVLAEVVQSVELLDRWRYGLAMAIASSGWESARTVLDPLLRAHPGVVAWAVHEAIPQAEFEEEGPWPDLPADVVSQRLQETLDAWQAALSPAGDRIFFSMGRNGPVTVDAFLEGNRLGLHIPRRDGDHTPGLAIPAAHRWTEPRGVRPVTALFGAAAVEYAAWPWQKTLKLVASSLHTMCGRKDFDLADCDAYTKERLWLAAADLMKLPSRRFTPLRAEDVHRALCYHLYGEPGSLPVRSGFGTRFTGYQAELLRLEEELGSGRWADADGLLHSPYALPDQRLIRPRYWVWDAYSPEQLRLRTEQVLTAAVEIYTALVDTWFPHLKPVLGLASATPAALIGELYTAPPRGKDFFEPPSLRLALRSSPSSSVTVRLVPSEDALYEPVPPPAHVMRPTRSSWARPSTPVISEPEIFDDAPAADYAYAWLHEDLHRLHLTERGPRTIRTGLP
ncbi:hypothetical protein ABZT03_14860 [Streptomyces sp. NPDC005574]|uniref:hypothetical protein n=1 Tax=Streptomyces sp. NPDC005574 TaxID=3156891 RepID=UPI0033AB602A